MTEWVLILILVGTGITPPSEPMSHAACEAMGQRWATDTVHQYRCLEVKR